MYSKEMITDFLLRMQARRTCLDLGISVKDLVLFRLINSMKSIVIRIERDFETNKGFFFWFNDILFFLIIRQLNYNKVFSIKT